MAYTSDLRVKNLIKEIDSDIRESINDPEINALFNLRIFDESDEDAILYSKGGLSFLDPNTLTELGSNDAGWFLRDGTPLVIVEGTFGTERGQFGDGQLNRVSHSLGVALNGYIGVTLVPYKGQSFVKKGFKRDILSKKINFQNGLLHKGMATLAINYSKNNSGKFLIIDPYDKEVLKNLVINKIYEQLNKPNKLQENINETVLKMEKYLSNSVYGARSNQVLNFLYSSDGKIIDKKARIYTQNLEALTTSTKRDGHGLLGKNLIEIYSNTTGIVSIFIRMNQDDIDILKKRNSKEFQYLLNNKRVTVLCIDDLVFKNEEIKNKLISLKNCNLHQQSDKPLIKEVREAFHSGDIMIKLNQ